MQPTIQGTEGRPLWVAVAPHDTVRGYVGDGRGSAFSQGCCLQCDLPRGERTNEPLKVEEIPRGSQGFEVFVDSQIPNAMCCGCSRQVFSEDFLALLTERERSAVGWRAIRPYRNSRGQFFELLAPSPVPFVAKAGVSYWTWNCTDCGGRPGILWSPGYLHLPHFISSSAIPATGAAFAVAFLDEPQLCLSVGRWAELAGNPGCKGIAGSSVAVLDPALVSTSLAVYPIAVFEQLGRIRDRLWNTLRDEWLAAPQVQQMKADLKLSDDDVWDYIHSRVDDRLAFPNLHREYACEVSSIRPG